MNRKLRGFLENLKLTADTINSVSPALKWIAVIIAIVVGMMMWSTAAAEQREQKYIEEMRKYQHKIDSTVRYSDSLFAEVARKEREAAEAVQRAGKAERDARQLKNKATAAITELDSLKETITDSVEMARVIIPKQDSVILFQSTTIAKLDTANVELRVALVSKDSTIGFLTFSNDSLRTTLINIPTPPKPPLLPKITRKQALIGGTILGIALKTFVFK